MACGKTIFSLLTIVASVTCIPAEFEFEVPMKNYTLDIPPPHNEHDNRAGLFGSDGGFPNFGQLFGGFGGSNASNQFSQFLGNNGSDPFSQILSAFTHLIPGMGGSSNTGFPNLFSGFMPQTGRSKRSVESPHGEHGASNETDHASVHDRFFFFLFSHYLHNLLHNHHHHSNSNSNSNSNAKNGVTIGCNYTEQGGYSCAGCREQLICNSSNVGRLNVCPTSTPYCYNGVCGTFVNSTCTNSTG